MRGWGTGYRVEGSGLRDQNSVVWSATIALPASAVALVLGTFEAGKRVFINLARHITPICDCVGFTTMPILPDIGVFGSDDIVAIEQATLDMIAPQRLIEENLPPAVRVRTRLGHPFRWLHGLYKNPYLVDG